MGRASLFAALAAAALGTAVGSSKLAGASSPIKHIVVLMMENRSFDTLLGHLGMTDPRIDGVSTAMSCPTNTSDPNSPKVHVNFNAVDGGPVDPLHDFDSIAVQIFGFDKPNNVSNAPVTMNGFVQVAPPGTGSQPFVMSAFNSTNLPVLSTLATEYAVFDHWHCSCPCPTNPNREFLMSGTSNGMVVNTIPDAGFPQETHFLFLERHGISWKGYYTDDPWMFPAFADLKTAASLERIQEMPNFFADLEQGTLPQFSLLEPRMATSATGPSNWQHPDNSVEAGEIFINQVYTALRNSTYWNETLLVITYDEHGGFFDHQPTPTEGIPSPDGVVASNGFNYDRLGVRIPTVLVSPWIARNTVVNTPSAAQAPTPTSQWEATSIISSANKIFGITDNMTKRDAWAATFVDLVDGSSGLRTDCPLTMPTPPPLSPEILAREMAMPLNDHHLDSLNLLCTLSGHVHPVCSSHGDVAAQAAYVRSLAAETSQRIMMDASSWAPAGDYPHLHAPAARMLQQQHFGDISKKMWTTYKDGVIAAAKRQA